MIARLSAQRECLDHAATLLAGRPGAVLEIGLGKGRTYDRLRHLFPGRDVHAFDAVVHCPAAARPPPRLLWVGDFHETLAAAARRLGPSAVLAHADFGTEDRSRDAGLALELAPLIAALLAPGGIVASDRALRDPGLEPVAFPSRGDWDYFLQRRVAPP